jgi:hypothetical protein
MDKKNAPGVIKRVAEARLIGQDTLSALGDDLLERLGGKDLAARQEATQALAFAGLTTAEIAAALAHYSSLTSVYSDLKSLGVAPIRAREVRAAKYRELSIQGLTIAQIATEFAVSVGDVQSVLKKGADSTRDNPRKKSSKTSPEVRAQRRESVRSLQAQGYKLSDIAFELNWSKAVVAKDMLPPTEVIHRVINDDEAESLAVRIRAVADSGLGVSHICRELGISRGQVLRIALKFDIEVKRRTASHGKASTYQSGCRCGDCYRAYSAKQRVWKDRHKEVGIPLHVHGTRNGYQNYDCRCAPCKAAASKSNAGLVDEGAVGRRLWTVEDDAVAADYRLTAPEVASRLGRSTSSVVARRAKRKLLADLSAVSSV